MTELFADTSFFIALLNHRDRHHAEARRVLTRRYETFVTTAWVIVELGNYFADNWRRRRVVPFIADLAANPQAVILPPDRDFYAAGMELYRRRPDKNWSFTDCISFSVMRNRGITDALSADRHFEQAGFRMLLK